MPGVNKLKQPAQMASASKQCKSVSNRCVASKRMSRNSAVSKFVLKKDSRHHGNRPSKAVAGHANSLQKK